MDEIIAMRDVTKTYGDGTRRVHALRGVNLTVEKGQLAAITGRSGSGKSTLLNILTGIDRPTAGTVRIAGALPATMGESELATWRGRSIGVVFQFFQLLPTLSVVENVMLPMDFCDTWPRAERRPRALELLENVGIGDQADKFPSALSGGQQQRAAIARALANDPPVLVADEPTGNLDSRNAIAIFTLFEELSAAGKTIVVVTHESEFRELFDVNVELEDGLVRSAAGAEREESCELVS